MSTLTTVENDLSPVPEGSTLSGNIAEEPIAPPTISASKKKKKKKSSAKPSQATNVPEPAKLPGPDAKPALCISRNKHWKYISSYHGPWLQLPLEVLDSLLAINLEPGAMNISDDNSPLSDSKALPSQTESLSHSAILSLRYKAARNQRPNLTKPTPPPIDPGVFSSVASIRRLVDEASDLAVRASSGLSTAALGSLPSSASSSPWATATALGLNPFMEDRTPQMSAVRAHRLRVLAVQKLSAAYKADEIATSVIVMQGASALDDIAGRVLRTEPNNIDAQYVHFFHEKIPSRQLAESTTTSVLSSLIASQPQPLEFLRTRGIVHCFRDEFPAAISDFTDALTQVRSIRRMKFGTHRMPNNQKGSSKSKKQRNKNTSPKTPTNAVGDDSTGNDEPTTPSSLLHPSALPGAPSSLEHQLLFFRGAAFLQNALFLIEEAVFKLEGLRKTMLPDGTEMRLSYIENGKYGGVDLGGNPLGGRDGRKYQAYHSILNALEFKQRIFTLLRKSIRDHERFLSHFDSIGTFVFPPPYDLDPNDIALKTEYAFLVTEALRPGNPSSTTPPPMLDSPTLLTTYHPLLIESHFSILLSYVLLGDFANVLQQFIKTGTLVDGLAGYPIFLPARSTAQADFIEILERIVTCWKEGVKPSSVASGKRRLAIRQSSSSSDMQQPSPISPSVSSMPSSGRTTPDPPLLHTTQKAPTSIVSDDPSPPDYTVALDCARILLAPVVKRGQEKGKSHGKTNGKNVGSPPLNIPLHGPRVDITLAWLGAVHFPAMEDTVMG